MMISAITLNRNRSSAISRSRNMGVSRLNKAYSHTPCSAIHLSRAERRKPVPAAAAAKSAGSSRPFAATTSSACASVSNLSSSSLSPFPPPPPPPPPPEPELPLFPPPPFSWTARASEPLLPTEEDEGSPEMSFRLRSTVASSFPPPELAGSADATVMDGRGGVVEDCRRKTAQGWWRRVGPGSERVQPERTAKLRARRAW
mmetsp:Transcript_19717/g.54759  ORF Transcript_19717/g.54759 Transcript_19717/m.54759 type:complete len:201 (+) Transcript_19717:393-995(+)